MMTEKITKKLLDAGFKQYLRKLKSLYKKSKTKQNFDADVLYNAYNNGFTAGTVFCEGMIKKLDRK